MDECLVMGRFSVSNWRIVDNEPDRTIELQYKLLRVSLFIDTSNTPDKRKYGDMLYIHVGVFGFHCGMYVFTVSFLCIIFNMCMLFFFKGINSLIYPHIPLTLIPLRGG